MLLDNQLTLPVAVTICNTLDHVYCRVTVSSVQLKRFKTISFFMNFSISILPFSHYIFIFINELMIFTTIVFVCLQQLH